MIPIPTWLTWASFRSFLRQVAAIFGLVVSVANTFDLSAGMRQDIVLISGALLAAEHYANAINPATPPQSVAPASPPPTAPPAA
jgi:hypothetical protein